MGVGAYTEMGTYSGDHFLTILEVFVKQRQSVSVQCRSIPTSSNSLLPVLSANVLHHPLLGSGFSVRDYHTNLSQH